MGVLPLTLPPVENAEALGLDGSESYAVDIGDDLLPRQQLPVRATRADGTTVEFTATCRCDTPIEVEYLRHGGILHMVLRQTAET